MILRWHRRTRGNQDTGVESRTRLHIKRQLRQDNDRNCRCFLGARHRRRDRAASQAPGRPYSGAERCKSSRSFSLGSDIDFIAQKIARTFLKARLVVPLRPHPLAPQTGGVLQKAMGMHGKIQDKVCAVVLFECLISKNIL